MGFILAIAGTQQASISWPDREAERYIVEDMARNGVEEVIGLDDMAKWKPPTVAEVLAENGIALPGLPIVTYDPNAAQAFLDATKNHVGSGQIMHFQDGLKISAESIEGMTIATDGTVTPAPGTDIVPDGQGGAVVVDAPAITEVQAIRNYLAEHGSGTPNKQVIAALKEAGYKVESTQVSLAKKEMAESAMRGG